MQTMLMDRGVSLAINVKQSTLEHIARCSNTPICPHLDNISAANILRCREFRVEDVTTCRIAGAAADSQSPQFGPRRKTLMYVEGTAEGLGCTVLLRGARENELFRLKRIMRFAVFAAYCARLEVAFCADIFVALAVTLNGGLPPVRSSAVVTPPPFQAAAGDTPSRTWQEWAAALGQASLSEDRHVRSVSPYVQKWQVGEESGDATLRGPSALATAAEPAIKADSSMHSRSSSISDSSPFATTRSTTPRPMAESEQQEMARVYYEHVTQVWTLLTNLPFVTESARHVI
jgi:hypothetical protein